ncbi:LacI family DNA-binding transcriptional regulator [Kineococcus rhizosphaerae]|uniref:LacI family transcriptional regulator n=1 Tax=Kineococcus rhizosphaerae TaxID=559628 RepID=A0A2T0R7I6_9ACTN|nr:LacI family DNA-binding transcriptional regulator [Kineococcus rhizosphaerae]PRY17136.1 LacI family transcriptional regulator [Kineococcus rhizosphaerae]
MTEPATRRREPTTADVARRAGVAKATAARALGGYGSVSPEVRERVTAAAQALGYRPNELARSMGTGRSRTIGLVVGDIENGYFGLATRAISEVAHAAGYEVVLVNTAERHADEADAVRLLLDKRVDGLVVVPAASFDAEHLRAACATGRPVVLLDRRRDDVPALSVSVDVVPAVRELTGALLAAGHRRIAYLTSLEPEFDHPDLELVSSPIADRLLGMRQAFTAAGVPLAPDLALFGAHSPAATAALVDRALEGPDPATAVVSSDAVIALDVLTRLRERGEDLPGRLSFASFDDAPWAPLVDPAVTAVQQPIQQVGAECARLLLEQIRTPGAGPDPGAAPVARSFPARVVHRASIGPGPGARR